MCSCDQSGRNVSCPECSSDPEPVTPRLKTKHDGQFRLTIANPPPPPEPKAPAVRKAADVPAKVVWLSRLKGLVEEDGS